jgi:hypothetical protein
MSATPKPSGSKKPGKPRKKGKGEATALARISPVAPIAETSRPTSRITIALPFSKIGMQEPSQELADLVALVGDLLVALKDKLSSSEYEEFETQLDSLRARLR